MKILFISTYFVPYLSGLTVYGYRLMSYFTRRGHTVTVMTFRHEKTLAEYEVIGSISIRRLNYFAKISKGFISLFLPFQIWRDVRNTDIVFLNEPTFEGIVPAILGRILGKKIISLYLCTVNLGEGFVYRVISFFLNVSVYIQLFLSSVVVATSEDYAQYDNLLKHFKKKSVFIMPLVETYPTDGDFYDMLLTRKRQHIWLGFCGRIAREKGIEYAVGASQYMRTPTVFVFVGPYGEDVAGEEEYFEKIKKMLVAQNIPHIFLGKLTDDQLGAFYCAIDVLVMCSINSTEAFGMVQAEAMLAGTPVVASNMPGVRVPIGLTGMGYLARPRDPQIGRAHV